MAGTPRALVVVSDIHAGCQMALCPPEGIKLDEGGHYEPNLVQLSTWEWWCEFWDEFVPVATRREPYDLLVNGDLLDNEHHGVKTLISNNKAVQREVAKTVLGPRVERCQAAGGRLYVVRGTSAHDGGSGEDIEDLARELGAVPNEFGRHSRWELWKRIEGPQPYCLVHALHHIGTTSSTHRASSAVEAELADAILNAAEAGEEPPLFVVRSHRHRYNAVPRATVYGRAWGIVTPGWQAKTSLAYRVAGARVTQPQFGGIVIRNGDEEAYHREFSRKLKRPRIEV